MRTEEWRPPTTDERALLDTLALADVPGAGELRSQLARVLVAGNCGCGCGSLDLQTPPGVAPINGFPRTGDVVTAQGVTPAGTEAWVGLEVDARGFIARLESWTHDNGHARDGLPLPRTLVQVDLVRRGGDVCWLVPRAHPILEAAARTRGD